MNSKLDIELYKSFQKSPIFFVEKMWGLIPQPLKSEYKNKEIEIYRPEHFQPFERGKHITWQQWILLRAFEKAVNDGASPRISVRSGRGIGKTASLSFLILWYLFCYKNAQIPCTAPTADQLHDALWKELSIWLEKMPKEISDLYEWQTSYVRIKESPETWFARAKTARKENPEALAGAHGEHVMLLGDEASGIPEQIFKVAEGALTDAFFIYCLISNPRRLTGYFYDTHHKDKSAWQTLHFNAEESPIVNRQFVDRIIQKYGRDSDEYRVEVLGEFPNAETMDDKGYVPLLTESEIHQGQDSGFIGDTRMGIDPAGSGKNKTSWGVRDSFKFKIVGREDISNPKSVAQKTLTWMIEHKVKDKDIFLDNFGSGANISQEMALASTKDKEIRIRAVNVGDPADDSEKFLNKRAECYWRVKQWFRGGGEIVGNIDKLKEQLLNIKYRSNLAGKIQIMSKKEMLADSIASPDDADTMMLTFYDKEKKERKPFVQKKKANPWANG